MNQTNAGELITLLIIALIVAARYWRPRWRGTGSAYGTSAWARIRDLAAAGMLEGRGLILGRMPDGGKLVRMPGYCHTSVYAPTGAGKGVSFVVPTLLSHFKGSMFVFDPKQGENFKLTAKHRAAKGQQNILLDPFHKCGRGACYNPLDAIRDPLTMPDEARALAEAMVVRPPEGDKDPFWNNSAVDMITALILWTLLFLKEDERNLLTVREAICDPEIFELALDMLCKSEGIARQLGGQLKRQSASEKELAGVVSTASTHTAFLSSALVARTLSKSTFSLEEVFLKPASTVYLVLPVEQILAQRNLLRLLTSSFMQFLMRYGDERKNEVLFVLDECALLSHLPALEQAVQIGRSSGIRLQMYWQTYEQAKAAFKDKPGLIADNSDCQIFFGTNSYPTAELISKSLGPRTITITSGSENGSTGWSNSMGNYSNQGGSSWGSNYSEIGRPLLNEAEVLTLSPDLDICFIRGLRPLLLRRIKWFREKALFGLSSSTSLFWWLLVAACVASLAWVVFGW